MDDHVAESNQLMREEVLRGLAKSQKTLPSKYFYDEQGSKLFNQITKLDEYYLTRSEREILQNNIDEIVEVVGKDVMLVELGSGSSDKTHILLQHVPSLAAYVPVDISQQYLLKVVSNLRIEYPKIPIIPVFADYTTEFQLPNLSDSYQKQLVFFPGSTIGNFKPKEARTFIKTIATNTDDKSGMLIGVDLIKEKSVLEKAYNDEQGLTAEFNKNILVRLNRELDADFNIDAFKHHAFFNEEQGRIEMHLIARREQRVTVAGEVFHFEDGESIHTENSYKYSLANFEELVSKWYSVEKVWTDENDYFSVQYLTKK